jgi:hypothetical protein
VRLSLIVYIRGIAIPQIPILPFQANNCENVKIIVQKFGNVKLSPYLCARLNDGSIAQLDRATAF